MSNENIETGAVIKDGVLFLLAGTIVKLDGIPCRVAVDTPIESEHYRQVALQAHNTGINGSA